jgi:hypothetical protein
MNVHSLRSLEDIMEFREERSALEFPIDGIPIYDGYRCLVCDHYMIQAEAMRRHLQSHGQGEDNEAQSARCKVQSPFGGRLRKCFGLVDRSAIAVPENNDSAWNALSGALERKRARVSTEKEENLRFVNSFVARTRWDVLVEDHDWKKLKDLAAAPKTETLLDRIIKLTFKHFDAISDKLRVGDVLIRRKLRSTGYVKSR